MNTHDSVDPRDPPQTKKRRLNLVKCDRCRLDKKNVWTLYIFEVTMANLCSSVLP
jgi:hypothetical protein